MALLQGTVEEFAAISTIVASIAVFSTAIIVWKQVRLQGRSEDKDNKRFLRETIVIIHETLQDDRFRRKRRSFKDCADLGYENMDSQQKGYARSILATYGMLARMTDKGAIDEKLLKEYWRDALRRDWKLLEPFVEAERAKSMNNELFEATQKMAERWKTN